MVQRHRREAAQRGEIFEVSLGHGAADRVGMHRRAAVVRREEQVRAIARGLRHERHVLSPHSRARAVLVAEFDVDPREAAEEQTRAPSALREAERAVRAPQTVDATSLPRGALSAQIL